MSDILAWRNRWQAVGVDTLPLRAGTKKPVADDWPNRPSDDLWNAVGTDFEGNMGVRAGNGLLIIDCDTPDTAQRVEAALTGLGINPIAIATPSGGQHFYIRIEKNIPTPLQGNNFKLIAEHIGKGELRFGKGSQVATPPSIFNGKPYQLTSGQPEDLPGLRVATWQDMVWLLPPGWDKQKRATAKSPFNGVRHLPVRLVKRDVPANAVKLLEQLHGAPDKATIRLTNEQSKVIREYETRSNAEMAVVIDLILAGWNFNEIHQLFEQMQPGHYMDKGGERYLMLTYNNAIDFIAADEERLNIAEAYNIVQSLPWPGSDGLYDCKTLMGLLAIGYQFNSWQIRASIRDLSEYAAADKMTIWRALQRLQKAGIIVKIAEFTAEEGNRYDLEGWGKCIHKMPPEAPKNVTYVCNSPTSPVSPELWARIRLGYSAEAVYIRLTPEAQSISKLAKLTGKDRKTVREALNRLAAHGLSEEQEQEQGWVIGSRSLEEVAQALGADKAQKHRRAVHKIQRAGWRRLNEEALG